MGQRKGPAQVYQGDLMNNDEINPKYIPLIERRCNARGNLAYDYRLITPYAIVEPIPAIQMIA